MTGEERAALIARYRAGYDTVVAALAGISPEELDWRPAEHDWSAREIVHHLADSEMTSGHRLRQLLAEQDPVIQGYDEVEFARRLAYQARPIEPALRAFEAARATTAQILDLMTDADWQRQGTHTESGPYSAIRWLEIYAEHAEAHARQIGEARARRRRT